MLQKVQGGNGSLGSDVILPTLLGKGVVRGRRDVVDSESGKVVFRERRDVTDR